jgi:hypothetical protein
MEIDILFVFLGTTVIGTDTGRLQLSAGIKVYVPDTFTICEGNQVPKIPFIENDGSINGLPSHVLFGRLKKGSAG